MSRRWLSGSSTPDSTYIGAHTALLLYHDGMLLLFIIDVCQVLLFEVGQADLQ